MDRLEKKHSADDTLKGLNVYSIREYIMSDFFVLHNIMTVPQVRFQRTNVANKLTVSRGSPKNKY